MGLFSKKTDNNDVSSGKAPLKEAKVPPLPPMPPKAGMAPAPGANPIPPAPHKLDLPPLPADLMPKSNQSSPNPVNPMPPMHSGAPQPSAMPPMGMANPGMPPVQNPVHAQAAQANHPQQNPFNPAPMGNPSMNASAPAPEPIRHEPAPVPAPRIRQHPEPHDDYPKVEVTKPEYFDRQAKMTRKVAHVKGPVFISLERYHEVKDLLSSLRQNSSDLRDKVESFKQNKDEGNDLLKSTVENLETIEEDIENINSTLRV